MMNQSGNDELVAGGMTLLPVSGEQGFNSAGWAQNDGAIDAP